MKIKWNWCSLIRISLVEPSLFSLTAYIQHFINLFSSQQFEYLVFVASLICVTSASGCPQLSAHKNYPASHHKVTKITYTGITWAIKLNVKMANWFFWNGFCLRLKDMRPSLEIHIWSFCPFCKFYKMYTKIWQMQINRLNQ